MAATGTDVWLYGTLLGRLAQPRSDRLRFEFSEEAVARWSVGSSILSESMQVDAVTRPPNGVTKSFFLNLLPEGDALPTLKGKYGVSTDYELLKVIGKDSAGALIIGDIPSEPGGSARRYLSDDEVAVKLGSLDRNPLGASLTVRHSLPGVQRKLLLGWDDEGGWYESSFDHPSTHILKPSPENQDVAANEQFCMDVGRDAGLEMCATELIQIGAAVVLVAQRYDRIEGERVHQEDGCQMLGVMPGRKCQAATKGRKFTGPSLAGIAALLSVDDKIKLLEAQCLNVLIGNADCHGKNVSVLHLPDGSMRLAPLYDVLSTTCHPPVWHPSFGMTDLTTDLGMWIGTARMLEDVTDADVIQEAASWGVERDRSQAALDDVRARIMIAIDQHRSEYPEIADYAARRAEQMSAAVS